MLVLRRKIDESVIIRLGNQFIKVTLLGVERDRAKLGFTANAEVNIVREEIDMQSMFLSSSKTKGR